MVQVIPEFFCIEGKLLKKWGYAPKRITTDKLKSYAVAIRKSDLPLFTIRDYERTIGRRTRISRFDGESENSSGSNRRDRHNGSCRSTPLSTTPSTSNAIFYRAAFSRRFETRRSRSGIKVGLLPDPDHDPIVASAPVNVSMPIYLVSAENTPSQLSPGGSTSKRPIRSRYRS